MNLRVILMIAVAAVMHLTPVGTRAQIGNSVSAGDAQRGKQLFVAQNCFVCHGTQGQGILEAGPRIGPPARSFSDFLKFVREPIGDMAPVSNKRVSDSDLTDIYAFLRTISKPLQVGASSSSGNAR